VAPILSLAAAAKKQNPVLPTEMCSLTEPEGQTMYKILFLGRDGYRSQVYWMGPEVWLGNLSSTQNPEVYK